MDQSVRHTPTSQIAATTALIAVIVIAFALVVAVIWLAATAIITILAGVLLAVLLDGAARGLGYVVPWRRRIRLVVVLVLAIVVIGGALFFGGAVLASQVHNFIASMKDLLAEADRFIENGGTGIFPAGTNLSSLLPDGSVLLGGATTIATSVLGVVVLVATILFLGAFFAWEPAVYKAALLTILPKTRRERVNEVLDLAAHSMREWLIGQSISMTVIFVASLVALILVGMPYPMLLAVQAGLLGFIPTLGPFVAGVIIILAGLSQSFALALYGVATYMLIQFLESHLVTPLVQERTISLPPAFTLGLQVISGMLFGVLGIIFAVPIAAAAKTLIQELYVEDCLGGSWQVPGSQGRSRFQRWLDQILGSPDE